MCGIAGYVTPAPTGADPGRLEEMLTSIRSRGPVDEGISLIARSGRKVTQVHTDRTAPSVRGTTSHLGDVGGVSHDVALVHTRYAVIDTSHAGHQPLVTADDRVLVAFQGEIFNYLELRDELQAEGARFRTASDTEVLAQAYAVWGDQSWERLNGLWAAAIFDQRAGTLTLCRDRLGIAPLYVAESQRGLFFGSSPLGVARSCFGSAEPADGMVPGFLETGFRDFDERTFIRGVRSLPAGTFAVFDPSVARLDEAVHQRYWDLPDRRWTPADLSLDEAAGRVRDTLTSAVELRLRADLEVAFQLSGGLDSTSIVALAAAMRDGPLPTYTVSVPEEDEEPLARLMTDRFSLDSTVLDGGTDALIAGAPDFAALMEEPLQSPGAFGHHRMCRVMKGDGFGVTLSGSGGDEVLAGYEWDFWPAARHVVRGERGRLEEFRHHAVLRLGSRARLSSTLGDWGGRLFGGGRRLATPAPAGDTHVGADRPGITSPESLRAAYPQMTFDERCRFHLRVADLPYYLASNDKATLGIPIEHRQPFLDHRFVELGLRLPVSYLFHRGWTKYVLRKAMSPFLPGEILWRREKAGFPFPVRRLLDEKRAELEPRFRATRRRFGGHGVSSYEESLEADALRLWRACSVGLWMESLG